MICSELKCGSPIPERPIDLQPLSNSSMVLNITCVSEENLRNCSIFPIAENECDGAAIIHCAGDPRLRLSGGFSGCAGQVEVLMDGIWGAVCDDHWDALDAEVTCRQLGCGSALAAYRESYFGNASLPIHMDDVKCVGSESFLWECSSKRNHDCTEREHAGVRCTGHRELRLSGGPHNCSGRLEVFLDGVWGTVCDSHWYQEDSAMLCAQLGCGSFVKHTKHEHSLSTSLTFVCSQSSSIWECPVYPKNPNTCREAKAVGIVCRGNVQDEMFAVTSPSTHFGLTASSTGSYSVHNNSACLYFIIICALLLILLLVSAAVFTIVIWRFRIKQKSMQQNISLTRHNEYRDYRTSTLRPSQPPDDSLQIPILYTGPVPPSPHTRSKEPVPASIPCVPPAAAIDDEEDYGFSNTPPKPLATFQDSLQEAPADPPQVTEYYKFEKPESIGSRGSSSTSSGEQNWYENYRFREEGAQDLMPPPQSYDGSSEYDDISSLNSV